MLYAVGIISVILYQMLALTNLKTRRLWDTFCSLMQRGWQQRHRDIGRFLLILVYPETLSITMCSFPSKIIGCASMIMRHIYVVGCVASKRCNEVHDDEDDLRTKHRMSKKVVATLQTIPTTPLFWMVVLICLYLNTLALDAGIFVNLLRDYIR